MLRAMMIALLCASASAAAVAQAPKPPLTACAEPLVSVRDARAALRRALTAGHADQILKAAAVYECAHSGAAAERPERYASPLPATAPLQPEERKSALVKIWRAAEPRLSWMRSDQPQGTDVYEAARVPADAVQAALASWRISGRTDDLHLARAKRAAEYLLRIHAQAGFGGFGFPVEPNPASEQAALSRSFVAEAKKRGMLDKLTRNGWIIDDLGNGDLFFDNGLAGQSLLAIHEATRDARYLATARTTAEWLLTRPMVVNFNYNGFVAAFLADLYRATGEKRWLDEAVARAELGVLSGQIRYGSDAGNWSDPHNKLIVYRSIMIGQLADLLRAMPTDHPRRGAIQSGLDSAILNIETQQRQAGGLGNLSTALVTHCKLAALARMHKDRPPRASDVSNWEVNAAISALRSGQMNAGPVALTCMLELM